MVKLKGQTNSIVKLCFAGDFADADGRALIRRFHEQRQAELRLDLREAVFIAVGASERDERCNIQTGVAQQTFCDVFIHAGGRTQHIGADKRQVRHPQHALQGAVFAQRAVNDREHHVNLCQRLRVPGIDKLSLCHAWNRCDADIRRIKGDARRIISV